MCLLNKFSLLLLAMFLLTVVTTANGNDKYCSRAGNYYCALSTVSDPVTNSYCSTDMPVIIAGVNIIDPDWTPNPSFPGVDEAVFTPWYEAYTREPSGTERLKGVSSVHIFWQSWCNPDWHPDCMMLTVEVWEFDCLPCKENETFATTASNGICLKRVLPDPPGGPCIKTQTQTKHPIDPTTGAKIFTHNDYRGSQPFPLSFTRKYNSMSGGWSYSYAQSLNLVDDDTIIAKRTDGNNVHFTQVADSWQTGLQKSWQLSFEGEAVSGNYKLVHNNITETYNTDGWLTSITNLAGQGVDISYADDTISVVDHFGNTLVLTVDFHGKPLGEGHHDIPMLVSLQTPDEALFKYIYDESNRLTHVQYPDDTPGVAGDNPFGEDNPVKQYLYEDSNFVTSIIDENGNRISNVEYDSSGRATSSGLTDGLGVYTVDYNSDAPSVRVTNPLGKDTVIHFGEINGNKVISQVEGQASLGCLAANKDYTYDSQGLFVTSKTDWNGNVTNYTRDSRGLELSRTEAAGTPQERTITTEWHSQFRLPTKITEPGKITEYTYDAQGRQLSKTTSSVQ